ncbi:MAG: sulfurtransferase TusA family protein [Candidatus Omnitrophota bacterium]
MFKLPEEIKKEIENYKNSLADFTGGKLSFARFTGIRVPWGIYSHRGRRVFMSRLRIPAGQINGRQLEAIAYAAKNFGSGIAHITTRQDIQLHDVKIEDTIKVIEYLRDYELSPRGGGGNTVRNITACPLAGVCKDEFMDVLGYAISLSEFILRRDNSYNLPRKFKIGFSGCKKDCVGILLNDKGFKVFVGGGMGLECALGQLLEEFIPEEELGYCVEAVKLVFYKNGDRRNKHHNRLRFFIQDIGLDKFKALYGREFKALKESEYIALRKIESPERQENNGEVPKIEDKLYKEFLKYNCSAQAQKGFSIVEVRIPRGDIDSDRLFAVAGLEKKFGAIELRTSQNQNLYIIWVKNQDVYELFLKLKEIFNEDFLYPGTLLDAVVCKGALTCNLGLCNSPGLSIAIEEMVKREFIGKKVFDKFQIRLNGCPNSCAQAPVGELAFYGLAKRVDNRPVPFYKFLVGGRKAAGESRFGEEVGLITARNVPVFLQEFLKSCNGLTDEQVKGLAKEVLAKFSFVPSYAQNREFYIDWGKTEDFSLSGLGPGECGAGVLDMIESDLAEAKIALELAGKENYAAEKLRKAIYLCARALLIVRGLDPRNEAEAFNGFKEKFIAAGIASKFYSDIDNDFSGITDTLSPQERKEKFLYAQGFFEHINQVYRGMDPGFNFPLIKKETEVKEQAGYSLDLKGTPCPINYVKTKLFLENLKAGDTLEVLLDEGEPIDNVPKSLEGDGHKVLKIEKKDGFYRVLVKKGS